MSGKLSAERLEWLKERYAGEVKYPDDHARAHIQSLFDHIEAQEESLRVMRRVLDAPMPEGYSPGQTHGERVAAWAQYKNFKVRRIVCDALGMYESEVDDAEDTKR